MTEVHTLDALMQHVDAHGSLAQMAVQQVDVRSVEDRLDGLDAAGSLFLGCPMSTALQGAIQEAGGLVLRACPDLPFEPFRARLYTARELFGGFDASAPRSYCDTLDARVYAYWQRTGGEVAPFVADAVFRGIHDQSISDALQDLLDCRQGPVVAMMGGHSMERGTPRYRDVALIARRLTARGGLMVSGGGPGAMEATHLGALTAGRPLQDLDAAIDHLATAPTYRHERWLATAFEVLEGLDGEGDLGESLGIPTWHYGHEPPTPFASHIAKYFANSIREAGLVTIAHDGIVFAPGSAGTIQEIFQDAAQNHYATTGYASPMVFLDETYWQATKPVYPLLKELARGRPYHALLHLADTADGVVEALDRMAPIRVEDAGWSFCDEHADGYASRPGAS